MMSDAVRNVVVRLSIEPGTVTMPDFSPFKTAREDVSRIITDMKTMGETLREVAATEQTLGQAARESAKAEKEKVNAHRTVEKSAKESADVQISESKRASEEMKRQATETANAIQSTFSNRRPLSEPGSGTSSSGSNRRPLTEPSNSISIGGDQATVIPPVDFSAVANVDESSARIDKHMAEFKAKREKESVDRIREEEETQRQVAELEQLWGQMVWKSQMALNQQRVKEEQKTADELMRTNSALNQQRLKEDQSTADSLEKTRSALNQQRIKEEQSTADALEKTRNSLNQQRIKEDQSTADSLEKTRNALNQQRLKEEQSTSDALTKTRNALNQQRLKEEQATEDALQKTRSALNQQRIREEEATATAIARTRDALNQQRMREDTQAAEAAQRAGEQLPRTFQQIQSGILGSVASSGRLAINIAMLSASGKKDTEELAKSFVSLQAKIGIITQTRELFTGMNTTLQGLRTAGNLTQTLVAQQQALGIATTFSQDATLRLAGAAAVAQAAMGPIAIIATAVVGAYVAADMALKSMSDSEEVVAKRKEEGLRNYDKQLQRVHDSIRGETILMDAQTSILEQQWNYKKLMLGTRSMSSADISKEAQEKTAMQSFESEQKVRNLAKEGFLDDEAKTKRKELVQNQKDASETVGDAESAHKADVADNFGYDNFVTKRTRTALEKARKEKAEADAQLSNFDTEQGVPQLQKIAQGFSFDDKGHANLQGLMAALEQFPGHMRDEGAKILATAQQEQAKLFAQEQGRYDSVNSEFLAATGKKESVESSLKRENTRFAEEQATADRFSSSEGKNSQRQALASLDRFDKAKASGNVNLQIQAAADAEKALQEGKILTGDTKGLLTGTRTDTAAVRASLIDDATIDKSETDTNSERVDKMRKELQDAENALKEFPALIKAFNENLQQMAEQSRQFQAAIRNYGGT